MYRAVKVEPAIGIIDFITVWVNGGCNFVVQEVVVVSSTLGVGSAILSVVTYSGVDGNVLSVVIYNGVEVEYTTVLVGTKVE